MTIDILALARECGFEFYPDADGNIDDDMFTGSRKELLAFGNAIIERCAMMCDEWATDYDDHEKWLYGMGAMLCAKGIRSMKAPTP